MRVEELLELSHHSLVQYRLPSTGELVPLLQIAPSKTDTERLLVVSPDLAEVLSAVIRRLQQPSGSIPLIAAYDSNEHVWLPPAPLLLQRRVGTETRRISNGTVRNMLNAALADTGLRDAYGQPLSYTPHDFRRLFITDAILTGLPPHIAQVIVGHRDINVTLGYKAVYPDEVIQAHRAFLARRRALRPTEEYRTPTDDEWNEFLGHFERRKVSAGLCGRAFATPCIHEHACLTEMIMETAPGFVGRECSPKVTGKNLGRRPSRACRAASSCTCSTFLVEGDEVEEGTLSRNCSWLSCATPRGPVHECSLDSRSGWRS